MRREKDVRGEGGGRKVRRHSWYKNGSDTHRDSTTASNEVLGTQAPTRYPAADSVGCGADSIQRLHYNQPWILNSLSHLLLTTHSPSWVTAKRQLLT